MTQPYFYIIEHVSTGKKYAGSRWMKNCHPSEFMKLDGYTTSSTYINDIITTEGICSFKILEVIPMDNPYEYETKFLIENNCANSEQWLNKHNNKFDKEALISYGSEKFKQIMVEKYGVDNCMKIEKIKHKQKNNEKTTLIKKYGVTHNTQIVGVKEKISKTMIERGSSRGENNPCYGLFGDDHPASGKRSQETIEKMKQNCGTWERTTDYCQAISNRQKENSHFISDNPMNDPEKRKLVSLSKIGKKKYINRQTSQTKMYFPGNEPDGFILTSKGNNVYSKCIFFSRN